VLLCFGQVDLNMNFLYQLRTRPRSESLGPEEFTERVVTAYISFITDNLIPRTLVGDQAPQPPVKDRSIPPRYIKRLFISTALMPVVEDDQLTRFIDKYRDQGTEVPKGVIHLEEIVDICGIEQRRKMVSEFNRRMAEFVQDQAAQGYNVKCMDINQYIIGPSFFFSFLSPLDYWRLICT
jgi:hypothetical protein